MTPVPHEMNKRNQWNTTTSPMAWSVLPTAHRHRPRYTTNHTPESLGGTVFHLGTAWALRGPHQSTRKTPANRTHQHQYGSVRRVRMHARQEMDINVAGIYCKLYKQCPFYRVPDHGSLMALKVSIRRDIPRQLPCSGTWQKGALYLKNPRAT